MQPLYGVVRKAAIVNIPWKNIAKYVFASAVMATILYAISHPTRLTLTLAVTVIGVIIYLALLLIIDKEARVLTGYVLRELKTTLRKQ